MSASDPVAALALDLAVTELQRDTGDSQGELKTYFQRNRVLWLYLASATHSVYLSDGSGDGDAQAQAAFASFRDAISAAIDDAEVRTWIDTKAAMLLKMARYLLEQIEHIYTKPQYELATKSNLESEAAELAKELLLKATPEQLLATVQARLKRAKNKRSRRFLESLARLLLSELEKPACGCKHAQVDADEKKKTTGT